MTEFRVFKTRILPQISEVRLYDETLDHVVESHPEVPALLPSLIEAVAATLANPTHVEESHSNSYVFVDKHTTNASGDPFRVPVKWIGGSSGRVKTFYFAETKLPDKKTIWRRDEHGQ
jgi:hypothetical protein